MALNVEKSFVVSDSETGEKVVLTQLENGNYSIKINSTTGELRADTFEAIGRAISEMVL